MNEIEKLLETWEREKGSFIPNAPIYAMFIQELKDAIQRQKQINPYGIKIMKYISLILITCWSCYSLYENGNLKPSDDIVLWILSVLSVLYSVVNILILYINKKV